MISLVEFALVEVNFDGGNASRSFSQRVRGAEIVVIETVRKLFIQKFYIVSLDPHFTLRYIAGTHASCANKN